MQTKIVFFNLTLNRIKVSSKKSGEFLRIFLSILYGDYILSVLQKTFVYVNNQCFFLRNKRVFFNDFIEFRFFSHVKNIKLKFHFLSIVFDECDFFIINKKSNLSVSSTDYALLDFLLYMYPQLLCVPKQGLVHRLDKCSIGLLIFAKTKFSFFCLSKFFLFQKITRIYNALISGILVSSGFIKIPLHLCSNKFSVSIGLQNYGKCYKYSASFYRIVKYIYKFTLVKIYLGSGRKHQIRSHFAAIGFPLIGDFCYYSVNGYQIFCNYTVPCVFLQARQLVFFHFFFLRFFSFSLRLGWKFKNSVC